MKAICMPDYQMRVGMVEIINKESKDKAVALGRAGPSSGCMSSKVICMKSYIEERDGRRNVGYSKTGGVMFAGKLTMIVREFADEVFEIKLGKMMQAFINVEPSKIHDGVHEVSCYEEDCLLYTWSINSAIEGFVVLKGSEIDNAAANIYLWYAQMNTWADKGKVSVGLL